MAKATKRKVFDYSLDFQSIDFRKHPELYVIGKGEQGVLMVEPYKSEILPHWKFKTESDAKESSTRTRRLPSTHGETPSVERRFVGAIDLAQFDNH